jgi:dolichol-phosphate mannosyltransferase
MTSNKAVVLLPTYNEKDNLPRIIPAILAAAPVDIMVLDDNSPDGTWQLADAIAAKNPRVRVVHRKEKKGLGRAYLDGMQRALDAGYEVICEMDADFSHPPEVLPRLLARIEDADLVLGSRNVKGGGTKNWPLHRQLISKGGSLYARTILGVSVKDMTGGFKVFRRRTLEGIGLKTIESNGYGFQIEMTYRAIQRGFKVVEEPFIFVERESGVSKMSKKVFLEAVLMCPKLRLQGKR